MCAYQGEQVVGMQPRLVNGYARPMPSSMLAQQTGTAYTPPAGQTAMTGPVGGLRLHAGVCGGLFFSSLSPSCPSPSASSTVPSIPKPSGHHTQARPSRLLGDQRSELRKRRSTRTTSYIAASPLHIAGQAPSSRSPAECAALVSYRGVRRRVVNWASQSIPLALFFVLSM